MFEAALRAVDHEYMMAFGRQAETAGVAHFQLVSAMGVDAEADRYGGAMGPYGLVKVCLRCRPRWLGPSWA